MALVVPTVLATSPGEYDQMLVRAKALSGRVHVDICDGKFADNQTVGLAQVHAEGLDLDLHLMLQDPTGQFESAVSLKPSLIIYHPESAGDIQELIKRTRELGVKAGVALLPQTSVESAAKLVEKADHVLIFTGHLGHNGGEFQADQLQKVAGIRQLNPDVEISVDGGVNDQNAALISMQGVDVLYTGGFINSAKDPKAAFDSISGQAGAE